VRFKYATLLVLKVEKGPQNKECRWAVEDGEGE
jgi:hypothetical protein